MKKIIGIALVCALAATLLAGCAKKGDDWSYIKGKKELIIGITPYEPMNYEDETGTLVGFDTEYAQAVCDKLGLTPKFIFINWETKEVDLNAKSIDCIWNGFTVSEQRRENVAFTNSYFVNEQVAVIRAADADKYTSIDSLQDASVVAEVKSAGETAALEVVPEANYTAVDKQATALFEVKAGTADVAIVDATMAEALTAEGTDFSDLTIVTTIDLLDEEFAIGFRLGSTAVAEFDKVTADLLKDGTLMTIAEKYGVADRLISE